MNENWNVVKKKKKSSKILSLTSENKKCGQINKKGNKSNISFQLENSLESLEFLTEHFRHTNSVFSESLYCSFLYNQFGTISSKKFDHMVCLGIGNFSTSDVSLLQLVVAVHLKLLFPSIGEVFIHDPQMSDMEFEFCNSIGFIPILTIIDLKKDKNKSILYWMPHCPYRLYCMILWNHWKYLNKIVIIGNSFASYSTRRIAIEDPTDSLNLVGSYFNEISVWPTANTDQYTSLIQECKSKKDLSNLEYALIDIR
eukprot:gene5852-8075_t